MDGNLDALAALLPIMAERNTELHFLNLKKNELAQTREFHMIKKYFPDLIEAEQIYLCLHLPTSVRRACDSCIERYF